uniref:Uncharacterized protein n=1 Tax=Romanomermis culicivorax TaxID=13658 RepID=A0A915JTN1_ROMCU
MCLKLLGNSRKQGNKIIHRIDKEKDLSSQKTEFCEKQSYIEKQDVYDFGFKILTMKLDKKDEEILSTTSYQLRSFESTIP